MSGWAKAWWVVVALFVVVHVSQSGVLAFWAITAMFLLGLTHLFSWAAE